MSSIALAPQISYDAPRAGQFRLTRRGRLVVLLLGLALALGAALWMASGSVATDEPGVVQVEVVTVAPGDTLWDIASGAAEGGDVRQAMQRIRELNALESNMLIVGQELRVPLD